MSITFTTWVNDNQKILEVAVGHTVSGDCLAVDEKQGRPLQCMLLNHRNRTIVYILYLLCHHTFLRHTSVNIF